MATSVASSAIVLEVLRHDNYEDWKSCIKYYLLAQGLWVVVKNHKNDDDLEWRKKNAAALHAIRISCSPNILSKIRDKKLAKEAWDFLAPDRAIIISNQIGDYGIDDYPQLTDAAERGDWQCANQILTGQERGIISGLALCKALRVANLNGREKFVEELVKIIPEIDLQLCNPPNVTVLHSAAMTGSIKIAKCIASKNERLLVLEDDNGMIPVTLAAFVCDEKMTRYLYSITPSGVLTAKEGIHGATLLTHWIATKHFDFALQLLRRSPGLALCYDRDGITPICALARVPSAFKSGFKRNRLQLLWYNIILARPLLNILEDNYRPAALDSLRLLINGFRKLQSWAIHILDRYSSVYNESWDKWTHIQAKKLLQLLCQDIQKYVIAPSFINEALLEAVSNGITEFIDSMIEANPDILWSIDTNQRNLLMLAVQNRQWDIFRLILRFKRQKKSLSSCVDSMGNNILHIAGCLAPSNQLQRIPGAAFQMQSELKWFKEVELTVHPKCKEERNIEGFTPRQLFTENHKNLKKKGEEWMKETGRSGTVVGALIMTITFAAIFTVPGGNDQNTGFPIFLHRKLFMVFIIADALSLVFSSTSVLVLFQIVASTFAEDDFFRYLPSRIYIGLNSLAFSVLALMVAFWAALNIMKDGIIWRVITSILAFLLGFWSLAVWTSLIKLR